MKKSILTTILLAAFNHLVFCQALTKKDIEEHFTQYWFLKSVEINNKPAPLNSKQKNLHTRFLKDSTFITTSDNTQSQSGRWHFDYKKQLLIFNDGLGDDPDIKVKIERLTDKECVLVLPEANAGVTKMYLYREE